MTTRTIQDLLAERRANVIEAHRSSDPVAKATLLAHVAVLDVEIATLRDASCVMTAKNTPGPWRSKRQHAGSIAPWDVIGADGRWVGTVGLADNARLIAAAPALLDASRATATVMALLIGAVGMPHQDETVELVLQEATRIYTLLGAAIAKATGEST